MWTAYTEKMTEYAELSIEVKQQWQLEAVYTLSATISAGVIPHKLQDILKWLDLLDLLHMTIQRSVIFKCKQHKKFLGDSTVQQ